MLTKEQLFKNIGLRELFEQSIPFTTDSDAVCWSHLGDLINNEFIIYPMEDMKSVF